MSYRRLSSAYYLLEISLQSNDLYLTFTVRITSYIMSTWFFKTLFSPCLVLGLLIEITSDRLLRTPRLLGTEE